ncbi:putative calcium-binding protein CML16 [Hordeum vulgare]|nr:putative calcium-binding protein CML16 [Hordeum vulgare]
MKKVFSCFHTDGDGRISPSELAAMSRAIAPPATESAGGREVASMMDELDTDRDGYVDLGEFTAFHGRGRGEREPDAELRDAFDVYDINGDCRISDAELSKVLSRIGEGLLVLAAKIGEGILLDHGTGLVIGETAVVGNWVSLMQVVVWFSTGYITIKDMVVTGMPIKIVGVAALTVLLPTLDIVKEKEVPKGDGSNKFDSKEFNLK